MPADLHIHTTFSDGTNTPEEIVKLAKKAGLTTIAITDHDGVDGILPAQKNGSEIGVEVIAGIELTTETTDTEIHILGYFIDRQNPKLLSATTKIREDRCKRVFKICEKLKKLGIDLDPKKVLSISGEGAPGRPHVARAMLDAGYIKDFKEAFRGYIEFNGPAYVSHYKLSAKEAIDLIRDAGGVAVYGHPAVSNCDDVIPDLVAAGLAGIEAYYSTHRPAQTEHYLKLAEKYGLLVTGGSDYHGERVGKESRLGVIQLPDELIDKLKAGENGQ
ncbi:MAG: PHP domain-containing protein [Candidatus Saganbacteria bacterium]|nr:PHP domain-containing protein [Candidatus Saganbacteria bacterium]